MNQALDKPRVGLHVILATAVPFGGACGSSEPESARKTSSSPKNTPPRIGLEGIRFLDQGSNRTRRQPRERVAWPRLRVQVDPEVEGLDHAIIRRVARRHLNEARYCYEQQLVAKPTLGGEFALDLVISPTGSVSSASVASTKLNDEETETCILTAARQWIFPAPEAGEPNPRVTFILWSEGGPGQQ